MSERLLLGADLGTTAIKVVLYRLDGTAVASATREYELHTPSPSVVEFPVDRYWTAFSQAIAEVLAQPEVEATSIVAMGISAQGETLVPVDDANTPLRNAIVWLDNRATQEAAELRNRFGPEIHAVTGQPEMVPAWPAPKVLWIARNEPRIHDRAAKYLLIEDYFIARLTGEFVCEGSLATSTLYWNFRTKQWWPDMLDAISLSTDRLPRIVEPGTDVGPIRRTVAKELGLPAALRVCTGALDQACGAIGVGNVRPGRFSENTGAAVALCATVDHPVLDPKGAIPCHYHGLRDTYMLHTFTGGGIVLRWFRDQFAQQEMAVAAAAGLDAYDLLAREAATVDPGCEGLLMLPHLQGAMAPEFNEHARGVLVGLSLRHGKGHVARAILESIAFVVRRNIVAVQALGVDVDTIYALGGGARSAVWKQIEADITQREVVVTQHPDAATLGAAILAGTAIGQYAATDEAAAAMVRVTARYQPNAGNIELYDDLYGTFTGAYDALVPTFDRLAASVAR